MLNRSRYNSKLKIADCILCVGGPERVHKPNDGQGRVIALRPRINAASSPECIVMFNARRKDLRCQELIRNVLMWWECCHIYVPDINAECVNDCEHLCYHRPPSLKRRK